jgi:hypothetical protein
MKMKRYTPSGTSTAGSMCIGPATTKGAYSTTKHSPSTATRPGANDALALPTRIGDQLHHRNGRITSFSTPKARK